MKFTEWLKKRQLVEVGTCTASIAGFARPVIGGPVRRMFPDIEDTEFKKDKKKKKKD